MPKFVHLLSPLLISPLVLISSPAQSETQQLDDIVVVIKTGAEDLQQSPIAITSFSEQQLDESGASSPYDLLSQTPNMSASQNMSHGSLYLRGVGTSNIFVGSDPSVTVHYDGVYLGRFLDSFKSFIDVEQVEILRGPQGSLYGRNSIGGTVNIKTHTPDNDFTSKIVSEIGKRQHHKLQARVSGPLIEDKLFASLSLMRLSEQGFIKNDNPQGSSRLGDEDEKGLETKLRWLIDNKQELTLHLDHINIDETGHPEKQSFRLDNGAYNLAGATVPDGEFKVNIPYHYFDKRESFGSYAKYELELSANLSFNSLSAFRKLNYNTSLDADYSDIDVFIADIDEEQNQISQEFQLKGEYDNWSWLAGLYYFKEKNRLYETFNYFGNDAAFSHEVNTQAYAAFIHSDYALTEKLSLSAGLRYSHEEKKMQGSLPLLSFSTRQRKSWHGLTPKLSLDYQATPNRLFYLSASKGFKSGGFNVVLNNPSTDLAFDPEYLWAYEAGFKLEEFQQRIRLNGSIFHYDYQDMQVAHLLPGAIIDIDNAAKSRIHGIELEFAFLANKHWRFDAAFSWLDAKYKNHQYSPDGKNQLDVSGNRLNNSPEFTLNANLRYFQYLAKGKLSYHLNYYWQDESYFTAQNSPYSKQDSYALLNASLGFETHDKQWNLILYGNNLGNKAYINTSYNFAAPVGIFGRLNKPRSYGLRLIYNY